ncbi:MAG: phosphoribosylanthranilate isomerase [Planctomycetes bacterium]|nr:phosphoribosylanthranilate isomerase [Planctomycetota bacterium]
MVKVKICGITNVTDAKAAVRLGADALGFNFALGPRKITPERAKAILTALPPFVTPVALFVNEEPERVREVCEFCGIGTVQLHGDEPPRYLERLHRLRIIKALRVRDERDVRHLARYKADAYLLDTFVPGVPGGTGQTFRWELAREAHEYGPIIVAGGLTPENVRQAIEAARPYGVDVASGVESEPGRKDRKLMAAFIRVAKLAGL